MSDIDVQSEILEPMQRLYLPPRNMEASQQSEALREYVKALCGFNSSDLREAWSAVRDTHTTRSWPVPAAFIMAAKQARSCRQSADRDARQSTGDEPKNEWDVWKRVCRSQMARDAVREGVAWSLKCAVLNDKKLPEQIDLRELVSAKRGAELTAERIRRGQPLERRGRSIGVMNDANAKVALSMWAAIQQRETETQAEINYGEAA